MRLTKFLTIALLTATSFCSVETATLKVSSDTYKNNPFTRQWDMIISPEQNLIGGNTNYIQNNPTSTQEGGFNVQSGTTTGQIFSGEFIETTGSSALTGSFSLAVSRKNSNFTANNNSTIYSCNALVSSITVTLPTADSSTNRIFYFVKSDSTTHPVGLYPQSGQTVLFENKFELSNQGEAIGIFSDGSNWIGF